MTQTVIPGRRTKAGAEKNLCSGCNQDFSTVTLFYEHRELWKIVPEHTAKVCHDLIMKGKHHKGECQHLVGRCKTPDEMNLVLRGTSWWSLDGVHRYDRMADMRTARG